MKARNTKSWKTLIIPTLVVVITLLYLFIKPKPIQIAEITNVPGSVSLTLSATSPQLKLNQPSTITLSYSSPTERFTAIQTYIIFDPTYFNVSSFTPSPTMEAILQTATVKNGNTISFAYGVAPGSQGLIGTGSIMSFTVTPKKTGSSPLTLQNTLVTTIGRPTNALQSVANPTFTVINPSPSISPTPNPTPSPSITPTPSPVPSPSPSPTYKTGDLNKDGKVNYVDFNVLITDFGTKYHIVDFNNIITNYGK